LDWDVNSLGDSGTEFWVTLVEDLDLSFENIDVNSLHGSDNVLNSVGLLLGSEDVSIQRTWLGEVAVWMGWFVSSDETSNWQTGLDRSVGVSDWSEATWFVVWSRSLVSVDNHSTISDTVNQFDSVWTVDWDLVVVSSESVSVGIWVGE